MANIINRAEYGNLGCAWGVFKSRYSSTNDEINLYDLKCSINNKINSVDVCPGRQKLPDFISKQINRKYYCPFIQNRTDPRICQWVHALEHDPQKSKPVGQTAIVLDILGLSDLITTKSGTVTKIKWKKEARMLSKMEWGDNNLNEYIIQRILGYGPIINLAYYISNFSNNEFSTNELYGVLKIHPSNEPVVPACKNGTKTSVQIWDGNTSNDAVIRSTAALLSLSASAGLVKPKDYPNNKLLNPSEYYMWLVDNAVNNKLTFPIKWILQKKSLINFLSGKINLIKGISYDYFIPKPTDRNNGNKCSCCEENVINNARKQYGYLSRNRKLLLIESLRKANEIGKKVSIKKLSEVTLLYDEFYISKETQYSTLLNIERGNISLYGCINRLDNSRNMVPLINFSKGAFGYASPFIQDQIDEILSNKAIFVE